MWTLFKGLVILFWLTTTVLMVRDVYFPPNHELREVPVGVVIKGFLDHGFKLNSMQVFHNGEKIGHATVDVRKVTPSDPTSDYILPISITLEANAIPSLGGMASLTGKVELKGGTEWAGVSGTVRMPQGKVLEFHWDKGEKLPHFVFKENGQWKMDDHMALLMLGQSALAPQVQSLLPSLLQGAGQPRESVPTGEEDGLMKLQSREGNLTLAGQKRRGYMVDLTFMDTYHVKAVFTEAHELVLVELPEGYVIEDLNMYHLEPDIDDGVTKVGQ